MLITCRDLEGLHYFSQITLVAGEAGLDRAITWPYVNQTTSIAQWVHGGELVFITGMEASYTSATLLTLIQECYTAGVAGVVMLCHEHYIDHIPESVIQEANKLGLPLYEMPWTIKIVDISKEIANTIMQTGQREHSISDFFFELLFSDTMDYSLVHRLAHQCGMDLNYPSFISVFTLDTEALSTIYHEPTQLSLLQHAVTTIWANKAIPYLRGGTLIVYYPHQEGVDKGALVAQLEEHLLAFQGSRQIPPILGGIGCTCSSGQDLRTSYTDALRAMGAAQGSPKPVSIKWWEESGIVRIIPAGDNMPYVMAYCHSILGALLHSDRTYSTNYILTLRTYLTCNGNLKKTADDLFIHRNTLVYRLEKMTDLSGRTMTDLINRVAFLTALQVADFYDILDEI